MSGNKREFEVVRYVEEVVVDENDDEVLGFFKVEEFGKESCLF